MIIDDYFLIIFKIGEKKWPDTGIYTYHCCCIQGTHGVKAGLYREMKYFPLKLQNIALKI